MTAFQCICFYKIMQIGLRSMKVRYLTLSAGTIKIRISDHIAPDAMVIDLISKQKHNLKFWIHCFIVVADVTWNLCWHVLEQSCLQYSNIFSFALLLHKVLCCSIIIYSIVSYILSEVRIKSERKKRSKITSFITKNGWIAKPFYIWEFSPRWVKGPMIETSFAKRMLQGTVRVMQPRPSCPYFFKIKIIDSFFNLFFVFKFFL